MRKDEKPQQEKFSGREVWDFINRKCASTYQDWCDRKGFDEMKFRVAVHETRSKRGKYRSQNTFQEVSFTASKADTATGGRQSRNVMAANGMDMAAIMTSQGCRCNVCKRDLIVYGYHADHIMPVSKGGPNEAWNIQFLCVTCNAKKSDKDPFEWSRGLGVRLPDEFLAEYRRVSKA